VASLQQYALNFTEPTTTSTTIQQAQDGLCPSGVVWSGHGGQALFSWKGWRLHHGLLPLASAAICQHPWPVPPSLLQWAASTWRCISLQRALPACALPLRRSL
jgi:hypothetical protein